MPRVLKIRINHLGTGKPFLETIYLYFECFQKPFTFIILLTLYNTKEMAMLVIFSFRRYINEGKGQ